MAQENEGTSTKEGAPEEVRYTEDGLTEKIQTEAREQAKEVVEEKSEELTETTQDIVDALDPNSDKEFDEDLKQKTGAILQNPNPTPRQKLLGEVENIAGEEHRERAEDSLRQARLAWDMMNSDQQKAAMRNFGDHGTFGMTPKEVRDYSEQNKSWIFGVGKENLTRMKDGTITQYCAHRSARLAQCMAQAYQETNSVGKGFWGQVEKQAEKQGYGDITKALNSIDPQGGQTGIPEPLMQEFIEYQYANTVLRSLGARTIEIPRGGIDASKLVSNASATYSGELDSVATSQPGLGKTQLKAKKLKVIVVMSDEVSRRTNPGFERLIQDDMMSVAQLKEEKELMFGDGQNSRPLGIVPQADPGMKFDSTASSATDKYQEVGKMINLLENQSVPSDDLAWMMPPRAKNGLLFESTDQDPVADIFAELATGSFLGYPVGVTANIPTDFGSNETKVILANMQDVLIGEELNMRMEMSKDAVATDVDGTEINAFLDDAVIMKLVHLSDVMLRRRNGIAVAEQVTWGSFL